MYCITNTQKEGSGNSCTVFVFSRGIRIEPMGCARYHVTLELWTAVTRDHACTDTILEHSVVKSIAAEFINAVDY